jgi:hypothetical protein
MKPSFWFDQDNWPKDTAQWTFLARAHNQIGKSLFGEAWTGKEILEEQPGYVMPPGVWQLDNDRKDSKRAPLKARVAHYTRLPSSEFSQYISAEVARKLNKEGKPALERLHRVRSEIASQCATGKLRSGTRAINGGAIEPMLPELWNGERLTPRFEWCQIDLKEPFGLGTTGKRFRWIFIATDSLESFLKALSKQKPDEAVKQTVEQETNCRMWLIEEMQAHENKPKSRSEYQKEAKQKFKTGTRAFGRAWTDAIKITRRYNWSNRGRRPNPRQENDTPPAD